MGININTSDDKYKGPTFIQDTLPSSPSFGDTILNSSGNLGFYYHGRWYAIIKQSGDTGVFAGGYDGSQRSDVMDYVSISNTGNAQDFGNLIQDRHQLAGMSNGSSDRGVFVGGYTGFVDSGSNIMDYITISSTSNAKDFGDAPISLARLSATSNGTNDRGIVAGGVTGLLTSISYLNVIGYVTISSTPPADASDFGDLTQQRQYPSATSNGTNDRAVFAGGWYSSNQNIIDYITITSAGNASDFGDLTNDRQQTGATSNGTNDRAVFAGGNTTTQVNIIDYITITSAGNASDFGDLSTARELLSATSDGTNDNGLFAGGDTGSVSNIIDYIVITSLGDASDFGDLSVSRSMLAATSNG